MKEVIQDSLIILLDKQCYFTGNINRWVQWASVDNQIIHIIHYLRILTFFRLFPQLRKKVNAFFASFSHLGKTFVPLICFVTLYAVMGISFFQGHVESRCRLTPEPEMVVVGQTQTLSWEIDEHNELTCGFLECPSGTYCGNPADFDIPTNKEEYYHNESLLFGFSNFNNIQQSLFSVYNFLMVNGWIQTTYIYWRAQEKWVSALYFVSLVLILSQVFSNIILATMYEGFLNMTSIKQGDSSKILGKIQSYSFKISSLKRTDNPKHYESSESSENNQYQQNNNKRKESHDKDSDLSDNAATIEVKQIIKQQKKINQQSAFFTIISDIKDSKITKLLFLANIILSITALSLDHVQESIIAVIMIFYNEEWHITMYKYMRIVGYKSILFHLFCMLICQVLFIRLFIAIFINKFMKWLHIHEKEYHKNKPGLQTISVLIVKFFRFLGNLFCCFRKEIKSRVVPTTTIHTQSQQIKTKSDSMKIESLDHQVQQNEEAVQDDYGINMKTKDQNEKDYPETAQRLLIVQPSSDQNLNPKNQLENKDQFFESGTVNFEELKARQPTLNGIRGSQQFTPQQFASLNVLTAKSNKAKEKSIPKLTFSHNNPVNQQTFQNHYSESDSDDISSSQSSHQKNIKNAQFQKNNDGATPMKDDYISPKNENIQLVDQLQSSLLGFSQPHLHQESSQFIISSKNFGSIPEITFSHKESKTQLNHENMITKDIERSSEQLQNKNIICINEMKKQNTLISKQLYEQSEYDRDQVSQNNQMLQNSEKNYKKINSINNRSTNIPESSTVKNKSESISQQSSEQFEIKKQNSFFIFSQNNLIRNVCSKIVQSVYYDIIMSISIILVTIVFIWDSPFIDNEGDEKKIINKVLLSLSCIFLLDNLIQAIAHGFIINGPNSYFQKNFINIINFITALACFLYALDISKKVNYFTKYFAIFRIIILLSFLSKYVKQIEFSGKLILFCGPRMIKLILFGVIYLFMNGIIATKLLKGSSWKCSMETDSAEMSFVQTKQDCLDLGGDWIVSQFNFNQIVQSLQILFMVQSSEGWIVIMYDTFDSTTADEAPKFQQNSLWVLFYIQFFFIANICILNMFVGVVVESYQELIDIETKQDGLNKQQKEWYFIKKTIFSLVPTKSLRRPVNFIRRFLYDQMIKKNYLKYFFYFSTILNCCSFFVYRNRIPHQELETLRLINLVCLVILLIEILIRWILYESQYFYWFWNYSDLLALSLGALNIYYQLNVDITIFSSSYRILDGIAKGVQLLRFYRILKNFKIIQKLFKSLHFAVSSIFGIFMVLIIFLITSVTLALNLFPYLKDQSTINSYDINFRSFLQALFSLIRVVTSESWLVIPREASAMQSPNFVCREDMYDYSDYVKYGYNSCGSVVSYLFFYLFYLIFTLIILNIFIATIIESYKQAFSADESAINHYQFDDILQLWTLFDPEGKGYISYKEFWQFSSRIAIIYGVDSKELLDIKNKDRFLKTLNIPIYEDPVNKIFCYKFHDVIIKLSKASVQIKYGVYKLEHDNLEKREELDKMIKVKKIKGQKQIKETPFSSSDMVLMIVLSRKVKQWKKKYVDKDQEADNLFDFRVLAQKLRQSSQHLSMKEKSEEEDQAKLQNEQKENNGSININVNVAPDEMENNNNHSKNEEHNQTRKQKSMNFLQVPETRFYKKTLTQKN